MLVAVDMLKRSLRTAFPCGLLISIVGIAYSWGTPALAQYYAPPIQVIACQIRQLLIIYCNPLP